MHVAVAGGAGDLGSAVVRTFAALGVPTTALVHPRTDAWRLADRPGVEVARVDLLDTAAVTEVLRAHRDVVVVDAAGRSAHPGRMPVLPDRALAGQVLTTVSLWMRSIPTRSQRRPPRQLLGYQPSDHPFARPARTPPHRPRGGQASRRLRLVGVG